jgi:hypothetical protein
MKAKILLGVAALLTLGMSACDKTSKFATSVEGTWVGNTVTLSKGGPGQGKPDGDKCRRDKDGKPDKPGKGDKPCKDEGLCKGGPQGSPQGAPQGCPQGQPVGPMGGQMTVTPTLTFVKDKASNGGTFTYNGVYSVTQPVFTETVQVPFQATATVNVSAKGVWTSDEDDEINVVIEPSSVTATVDPTSIVLSYSVLTDQPAASLDSIKNQMAPNISQNFSNAVAQKVSKIKEFDDVKIVGNTMTLEMGNNNFTFTKQ